MNAPSEQNCVAKPAVVNTEWTLTSAGQIVQKGSSGETKGGTWASDTISREIGEFAGKPGLKCQLDVNFLSDAKELAAGDPHLTVAVSSDFVEGTMFLSVLIIDPIAGVLFLIGIILLLISFIKAWRHRRRAKLAMRAQ